MESGVDKKEEGPENPNNLNNHRYLAVDVALVGLLDHQVDEGVHVGLGGEGGGELRGVPEHHAVGDQGGGVSGSLPGEVEEGKEELEEGKEREEELEKEEEREGDLLTGTPIRSSLGILASGRQVSWCSSQRLQPGHKAQVNFGMLEHVTF